MNYYAGSYEVIEQQCLCEDTNYVAYGIRLNAPSYSQTICDISTDKGKIVRLVDLFNNCRLEGCQFRDAVEDFLAAC